MKLFKTSNIRRPCSDFMDMLRRLISRRIIIIIIIVQLCQELFHFELPSVQLARRRKLFLDKFCVCV